jgi:hypothetical protein
MQALVPSLDAHARFPITFLLHTCHSAGRYAAHKRATLAGEPQFV